MTPQKTKVVYLVSVIAVAVAFFIGYNIGSGHSPASLAVADTGLTKLDKVNADDFYAFWYAWQVLDDNHVAAASTTEKQKIYGAIQGLASSFGDPYTVFFPPVEAKIFKEDIAGGFEGVGMEIGIKNKLLMVVAPLKNSPAEKAGVKTGDIIMKIGDKSTQDMPVDQAVKLIRGQKGTSVKILFLPAGSNKPLERTLTRDTITVPIIDTQDKVAEDTYVIRLYSFTATSPDLFRNALRDFVASGRKNLILDLRGNPGGYLDAAWDMASYFLPAGTTVVTEDFGKKAAPIVFRSKGNNIWKKDNKMLILVDGGSASASEILAGALRENGIGKLVGSKTFGKGSVQELVPITSDTSLKVTIARWLTPNGHNLSLNGLDPDFPVTLDEKNTANGQDPALKTALDILVNGTSTMPK